MKKTGTCLLLVTLVLSATAQGMSVANIMSVVKAKHAAGEIQSAADLTGELKQLGSLYEENRGKNAKAAAEALILQAEIWTHLLKKPEKGLPLYQKIEKEFPDTEIGKVAATNVQQMTAQARLDAARRSLVKGVRFPGFDLKDFEGNKWSSSELKGKVYMFQFWASWCHACMHELPYIKRAHARFKDEGLVMLGVNQDDKIELAKRVVGQKEMNWPQIFDAEGELQIRYGASSLPRLFLVDRDGYIAATDEEMRGGDLEKTIRRVMKTK